MALASGNHTTSQDSPEVYRPGQLADWHVGCRVESPRASKTPAGLAWNVAWDHPKLSEMWIFLQP